MWPFKAPFSFKFTNWFRTCGKFRMFLATCGPHNTKLAHFFSWFGKLVCKKLYKHPWYGNIIIHLVSGSLKLDLSELWFWSQTTPEGVTASHQLCLSSAWWVFRALLLTENSWPLGPKTTPWEQRQWPKKRSATQLKKWAPTFYKASLSHRELQILVIVQDTEDERHLSHCHIVLDCHLKV